MSRKSAHEQLQDLMKFRLAEIKESAEQIQTCLECGGSGTTGTWGNYTLCQTCNGQGLTVKN
jgi:DnaJ-class molecular chaperone